MELVRTVFWALHLAKFIIFVWESLMDPGPQGKEDDKSGSK